MNETKMKLLFELKTHRFESNREIHEWVPFLIFHYGGVKQLLVALDTFYADGGEILLRDRHIRWSVFLYEYVF